MYTKEEMRILQNMTVEEIEQAIADLTKQRGRTLGHTKAYQLDQRIKAHQAELDKRKQ